MRETTEDILSTNISLENLGSLTRERIYTPIIGEFYDEFVRNGTNQALIEILSNIPPEHQLPILYTLTTHVTKEKPIFIYGIGSHYVADKDKVRFVAASTDLLWCLSLVVDDIFDKDTQRAGKETAWHVFGKEYSYNSAGIAFKILQDRTEKRLSTQTKDLLLECVNERIDSLKDPAIRLLGSGIEGVLDNIDLRARFHCEYPIRVLFSGVENEYEEVISSASEGLFCVNRAGQILNDVKDLIPSGIYGRREFSDISGGTSTIPLAMLYEELTNEEKQLLKSCFGSPFLTLEQIDWLSKITMQKLPRQRIHSLVLENYAKFLELMKIGIDSDYLIFCEKWVDYKLNQADILLSNSQN